MRINLKKKDLVNSVYMQIGFPKNISEVIIEDIFNLFYDNIVENNELKISNFGTFSIKQKKERMGRNPKTKEKKVISSRKVILFKASKSFKEFINVIQND